MSVKAICVYCGSSAGASATYAEAAKGLAHALVAKGIALVYGGGNVGLMGIVADEVLRLGGEVTGVIPRALMDKEVGHTGLKRLHVVANMHERKSMMAELADGFIAMPGGVGTLEELFEVFTWAQLGFHEKPLGVLNVDGYYDGLLAFLRQTVQAGFLKAEHLDILFNESDPALLLRHFQQYRPLHLNKWIKKEDL